MTSATLTMYKLEREMLAELAERKKEILADKYPEDIIVEIADSYVPIYHSCLAELLADRPSLGDGPDESGLVQENPTVWNILAAAVYERLVNEAQQWLCDAQEAAEAAKAV